MAAMTILDDIQTSIRQHAEGAGSSVVGIGQRWGVGSGIVLAEGRVLTNAHNVRGDQVTVTFADGRTAEGSVAGQDLDGDLAVIEVDTGGAPALAWADGASAAIGTPVFALSNPGGRGLRVTFGFVSGVDRAFRGPRGRRITGSLEHTAPLLPGSSGGPVLDAGGRLLGINTNRLGEGFYLAIHAAEGLLIQQVTEDSPAARAGLASGDLIVAAAGQPAGGVDALFGALRGARGGTLELRVVRGADERAVQVVFTPETEGK